MESVLSMIPLWLIEADVFPNKCDRLIAELVKQKVPYVVCKFGKSYEDYIADFADDACMVFHGSLQFASLLRRKTNWSGIYCNLPKFECLYYYPRFGQYLLNSDYVMLPFGELNRRKDWLFQHVGKDDKLFVRPSSGFKTFTGKVTNIENWEKDVKLFGFYSIDPEELVIAAPPSKIKQEWRVVVADNKIISGSKYDVNDAQYWDNDHAIERLPESVLQYVQDMLNVVEYQPDPAWTVDICELESGELKVVEVGSFSCAGIYASDPEPIVTEINKISIREWKENNL